MSRHKNKARKTDDVKSRIIKRQMDEIESLKDVISQLEIDCDKKDEIIRSIDTIRLDLVDVVDTLHMKAEEYDKLIRELRDMKTVFNQEVFKGRWRLIHLLMR